MERIPEKIDRFGELPPPKKNGMAYLLGSCPDACGYQNWRSRAIVLSDALHEFEKISRRIFQGDGFAALLRQENAVLKADGKGLKRLKILFRFCNFQPIGFPVGFLSFNRMFSES